PRDLPRDGLVRRWGVQAIGPPTLIERPVEKHRFSVEKDGGLAGDAAGTERDLAHAEVAGGDVQRGALYLRLGVEVSLLCAELRRSAVPFLGERVLHAYEFDFEV